MIPRHTISAVIANTETVLGIGVASISLGVEFG